MRMSPIFLKWNKTYIQGIEPMVICAPWADSFINNRNISIIDNQKKMTSCWKALHLSLNNCEVITQWAFVPLGKTLTYKTSNLNNLSKCLETNQCIDGDRCNRKNRNPHHDLPQSCGGSKSICLVWIWLTDNFQSHPRKKIQNQWTLIQ